jgi:cysteine-rich repeat protein
MVSLDRRAVAWGFCFEDCDDANDDNTDTCVVGCKAAACGDGFVGPGESCDDGNQVDDDECGNNSSSQRPPPPDSSQASYTGGIAGFFRARLDRATDRESPAMPPRFGEILEKGAGVTRGSRNVSDR